MKQIVKNETEMQHRDEDESSYWDILFNVLFDLGQ